jgi:hypothetical protein
MFLQRKFDEDIIEVLDSHDLFNPCVKEFLGRSHCGEEIQDPQLYPKAEMVFPSGEPLPICWLEPNYRLQTA